MNKNTIRSCKVLDKQRGYENRSDNIQMDINQSSTFISTCFVSFPLTDQSHRHVDLVNVQSQ